MSQETFFFEHECIVEGFLESLSLRVSWIFFMKLDLFYRESETSRLVVRDDVSLNSKETSLLHRRHVSFAQERRLFDTRETSLLHKKRLLCRRDVRLFGNRSCAKETYTNPKKRMTLHTLEYIHTHKHTRTHTHTHTHTHAHTCTHTQLLAHVNIHKLQHACTHLNAHTHILQHTHTHTYCNTRTAARLERYPFTSNMPTHTLQHTHTHTNTHTHCTTYACSPRATLTRS